MIHDMTLPMSPEAGARWAGILEWAEKELGALEPGEALTIMEGTAERVARVGLRKSGLLHRWQERVDLCG